jgi:hypothetical protein
MCTGLLPGVHFSFSLGAPSVARRLFPSPCCIEPSCILLWCRMKDWRLVAQGAASEPLIIQLHSGQSLLIW